MNAPIIIPGVWTIKALSVRGRRFAMEYVDSLQLQEQEKILSLLLRTSQNGPPKNREKFRKVGAKIFEFKSYQDRILCFFRPNNVIVLTHGFRKKRDRTDRAEIVRATDLRCLYLEREGD
jgi:phage-related protein